MADPITITGIVSTASKFLYPALAGTSIATSQWQKSKQKLQNIIGSAANRHVVEFENVANQLIKASEDKLATVKILRQLVINTIRDVSHSRIMRNLLPAADSIFKDMLAAVRGSDFKDMLAAVRGSDPLSIDAKNSLRTLLLSSEWLVNGFLDLELKHHLWTPDFPLFRCNSESWSRARDFFRSYLPPVDTGFWASSESVAIIDMDPFHRYSWEDDPNEQVAFWMSLDTEHYLDTLLEACRDVFDSQQKDHETLISFMGAEQDKKIYKAYSARKGSQMFSTREKGILRTFRDRCPNLKHQMVQQFKETHSLAKLVIDGYLTPSYDYTNFELFACSVGAFNKIFLLGQLASVGLQYQKKMKKKKKDLIGKMGAPVDLVEAFQTHLTLAYVALHENWVSNSCHEAIRAERAPDLSLLSRLIDEKSPLERMVSASEHYFDQMEAQIKMNLKILQAKEEAKKEAKKLGLSATNLDELSRRLKEVTS